ncbi:MULTISPECIES: hypothetical protein [Desulfococcus]|jgi:hypothetical protein|uniref:Uncharacterized protein n=1 Tax=Desulfococcus multivorans DSM 2059 TaxID=1121405 RepID=S7V8B7_DESML|nr:hypothetical protein [Desulfococcus multivorans]AOY57011.1 uncharacterized protein Dmul_02350 [Desulfococcus multivorans]AQU99528.1 hypothetical protein B2D07_01175 [Desulfococcus multivorans]EPR42899.1 hypothetical protein dsmv_1482 [Desulfococcus multivorans DSM 2059]MDX9818246.1 hypothetical protein [Desulfococcus multivorans]SJZ89714.1 hypothetical protein SAMN02745446_02012 [Desulfococcus multivorans DSM 2059]
MAALLIEVTFKHQAYLPSRLMSDAVSAVLPRYGDRVAYRPVDLGSPAGRDRFLRLSVDLFGETAVFRGLKLAPIPGLFMNGRLAFDIIPPQDDLEAAIEDRLNTGI